MSSTPTPISITQSFHGAKECPLTCGMGETGQIEQLHLVPSNKNLTRLFQLSTVRTNIQPRVYIGSNVNLCPQTDEVHTRRASTTVNNTFLGETCVPLELYFLRRCQASICTPPQNTVTFTLEVVLSSLQLFKETIAVDHAIFR